MRSPSQYSFAKVPQIQVPRSAFKRDRSYKSCFNSGYLIPFFTDEVYPGDTFNVGVQAFARLSTPILPFMDNLFMDFFFFYVPYRLLWEHWNNFLGEQKTPNDTTDYLTPIVGTVSGLPVEAQLFEQVKEVSVGSLFDYLGFPTGVFGSVATSPKRNADGLVFNAFLPRAYNKIWNDHFRDENLQDPVHEFVNDGPDYQCGQLGEEPVLNPDPVQGGNLAYYRLLKRGKRKDYFTSCLPWPQKGPGAEINITSTGNAPVWGNGDPLGFYNLAGLGQVSRTGVLVPYASTYRAEYRKLDSSGDPADWTSGHPTLGTSLAVVNRDVIDDDNVNISDLTSSGLYADLSRASFAPVSINDLRMAFQLQRLMEKNARGGTRINELILTHFGVVCPDYRLQRSEFLGGGEIPIQIHQVTQTSATSEISPQGNTAAFGVASGRVGFSKSFVEHGVVMGLVSVRADLTYQQGLHRSWTRRSRYDYYWPTLAHLGEQAVLNQEIFASGKSADDNKAFGYQERWAELRYGVSQITGKLRSQASEGLDVWHLAQYFDECPKLNSEFIEDNPPVSRVVAVPSEPEIVFDSLIQCNCVRPMPMYSVPGLIDHF